MADAAILTNTVITSFVQGVRALNEASANLNEAPSNFRDLNRLVKQLEESLPRAHRKYSNKLHNDEFKAKMNDFKELVNGFKLQVSNAERLIKRKGVKRTLACCWSAMVGDELKEIAYTMENQLQKWLEQQNVPISIDEALDRYAQGLPSFLTLQAQDGYHPLNTKVNIMCEALQRTSSKVILIHGLSGIGKSSLAHYIAANCLPTIFTDGSAKILLGYGCSKAAVGYNTQEYHRVLTDKVVDLILDLLRTYKRHEIKSMCIRDIFSILEDTLAGKRYLIIIDDLWEMDIIKRFMRLQGNHCKYLVTSRLSGLVLRDDEKVEITKEDVALVGREILQHHCQMQVLPESADLLLERCGYHPLTITVMGQALRGETRNEEWMKAIDELSTYASNATSETYMLEEEISDTARTVFGSLEFSLKAMKKDSVDLFTSFATLSWVESIPEACLEELWHALGAQDSTFRLAVSSLLKGSLIGKSSLSYIIHDMVALYLDKKELEGLKLLGFPGTKQFVRVSPWLYRYGKETTKMHASNTLRQVLRTGDEALQANTLEATVDLRSIYRNSQEQMAASSAFVQLLGPEIPRLIPKLQHGGLAARAVLRFMDIHFLSMDWESNLSSFLDTGLLMHIYILLKPTDELSQSAIHVVEKLAEFISVAENSMEALQEMPIAELVLLLDPSADDIRNIFGRSVMKALIVIARAGGQVIVDRMFSVGLGEMIAKQVVSDYHEFSGAGMKELNLLKDHYLEGGSIIVETFVTSNLLGENYHDYFHRCLFMV